MQKFVINSRRLYQISDPLSVTRELNRIALQLIDGGWKIKRGDAGTVILTLRDGEIHYIPTSKGIEEIIFERSIDNE